MSEMPRKKRAAARLEAVYRVIAHQISFFKPSPGPLPIWEKEHDGEI